MMPRTALLVALIALVTVSVVGCAPTAVTKFDVAKNLQNDKKFQDAVQEYKAFISDNNKSSLVPYALYNIAWCHRGMGRKQQTLNAYQNLIDQYPGSDPAAWAKVEMRRLKGMTLTPPKGSKTK